MRELEMNWYLNICELSYEHTVAYTTGMPHRTVSRGIFSSLLSDKCIEAGLDSPACNPKTQRKMLYEKPIEARFHSGTGIKNTAWYKS
ncbi:hypothetical protein Y1Q_0024600 [Alligator mississippiensis]|uniref:Uncharacterized protein n=1 Tax=Alligator mississippiensis TaxID=8496 RepID=A0A151NB43_ALLMI|nr:hypothetical protein Y1Q_0024600 [Alligator mississippiensis]